MPGCPTFSFGNVTGEVWTCLLGEARRLGVPVPQDASGTVSAQGATVEWRWDEAAATLSVTFTQIPPWIDCGTIQSRLSQAVRACGGR